MPKTIDRLSDMRVRTLKQPGYYADGDKLYLRVSPAGSKGWIFRFTLDGRTRDMGLGPYPKISLARAREKAEAARALVAEGVDPIDARDDQRAAARAEKAAKKAAEESERMTFAACVRGYVRAHEAEWTNAKHRTQWFTTLETYAFPVFGNVPVAEIDQAAVLKVLSPIWKTRTQTASRIRGRIERVLDWAKANGYREGSNPARWAVLQHMGLGKPSKVAPVENFNALAYKQIGQFMKELRASPDEAAKLLEFTILTAVRTNEALGARWDEIEEHDDGTWSWRIPAERTKLRREHRVPLSKPAVELLKRLRETRTDGGYIFPGRFGGPLSDGAMLMLLERLGRGNVTVHGFRSTFRDWSGDETDFPRNVCEHALAHKVGDMTEAAYRRSDAFKKRHKLMEAWAAYCGKIPRAKVPDAGADTAKVLEFPGR
jgi:integrase